jgi:hypothetical protein
MKKTVQIVAVPLNGSGKLAKKDISGKYELAEDETVFVNGIGYIPQQLLVLNEGEIREGDWIYKSQPVKLRMNQGELAYQLIEGSTVWYRAIPPERKIIASYPRLEGTLPLSKDTVQDWIDSGTPKKGSIKIITGHYIPATFTHSDIWVNFAEPKPENDDQGNLLIKFGKKK